MTKTFIVAGPPYSGTSLIAGTLMKLGVFMGETFMEPGTYEDADFYQIKTEDIYDLIWKRNQEHNIWGFKYPLAYRYMWNAAPHFKNPYVIFAYRNVCQVNKKHPKREIFSYLKDHGFWGAFLEIHRFPTIIIDYEKSIQEPEWLVTEICKFGNLNPSYESIVSATNFNTRGKSYNIDIE